MLNIKYQVDSVTLNEAIEKVKSGISKVMGERDYKIKTVEFVPLYKGFSDEPSSWRFNFEVTSEGEL